MRILSIAIALGCVSLSCAGCASVTRGWDENIAVATTPSGATATVNGLQQPMQCMTPCSFQARRADELSIVIEKEGYEPQIVNLTKEIASTGAAGFAGNLLLGGVVGAVVDGASGAALDHKPNPVIVTLQPVARAAPPPRSRRK